MCNRQQGAALVTVLIFLAILFLLGTSSMQGARMEERMAGNSWDQSRSFHAAESCIQDAIAWITSQSSLTPSADGSTGVYEVGAVSLKISNREFDWSTAREYGTGTTASAKADFGDHDQAAPRYIVESLGTGPASSSGGGSGIGGGGFRDSTEPGPKGTANYYSIWVIGYGKNDTTNTILNAVVAK